jgi:formamidopyrimidine-DNA glycosylase
MPELPEVEFRLRYFRRVALGEKIVRVRISAPNMIKSSGARTFAAGLAGREFISAERRGKYLIVQLDNGRSLILHFGMGGDLYRYRSAEERPAYTRIEFFCESGWRLAFTCPRKICRVMLVDSPDEVPALREMGPEPLGRSLSRARLESLIEESPRRLIKPLLMDQRKIAGVGNIYADEILFEASVRPDRPAAKLGSDEIDRIHRATRRVLRAALKTASEDYFPDDFLVSRSLRSGRCKVCGEPIVRKTISGRTAYFCARCQV